MPLCRTAIRDTNLSQRPSRLQNGADRDYTAGVVRDVETAEPEYARPWLRRLAISTLFILLTVVMTWPMALHLVARSVDHFDIYFNLWRLQWIHHALTTSPTHLFDGNQFFPERGVLSYSDAIL